MRRKMQGGGREEYSTYEQDVSELEARHKKVDVSSRCLYSHRLLASWLVPRLAR